jgi:cell division septation protein DedD
MIKVVWVAALLCAVSLTQLVGAAPISSGSADAVVPEGQLEEIDAVEVAADTAASDSNSKVVENIQSLKAYCIKAQDAAADALADHSSMEFSVLIHLIKDFGADPAGDNLVQDFALKMGTLRVKFGAGIPDYILDHLQQAIFKADGVVTTSEDGKVARLDYKALGFEDEPDYIKDLGISYSSYISAYTDVQSKTKHAQEQATVLCIQNGLINKYQELLNKLRKQRAAQGNATAAASTAEEGIASAKDIAAKAHRMATLWAGKRHATCSGVAADILNEEMDVGKMGNCSAMAGRYGADGGILIKVKKADLKGDTDGIEDAIHGHIVNVTGYSCGGFAAGPYTNAYGDQDAKSTFVFDPATQSITWEDGSVWDKYVHPCKDGSHGCDKGGGGICTEVDGAQVGQYTCSCDEGYSCMGGCDADDTTAHSCMITEAPTMSPTAAPTPAPTEAPTNSPTDAPTAAPTTLAPTASPTQSPTAPTGAPTFHPCNSGDHGCDKGDGGVCMEVEAVEAGMCVQDTPITGTGTASDVQSFSSVALTSDSFTVSMWLNIDDASHDVGFFSYGRYSSCGFMCQARIGSQGYSKHDIHCRVSNGGRGLAASNSVANAVPGVAGSWEHLVVVKDKTAGQIRFYVDGQPKGVNSYTVASATCSDPFQLGGWPGDSSQKYLDGSISGAYVYEKALSDAEVASLYASTKGTKKCPAAATDYTCTCKAGYSCIAGCDQGYDYHNQRDHKCAITVAPTDAPTKAPTKTPTDAPTNAPSNAPTARPTPKPTVAPTAPLTCPGGTVQQGAINADIPGCGLTSCSERYSINSIEDCKAACVANDRCSSFNWAPKNGDKNHMEHSACTLYSQDAPTSTWGPNQIFCKIEKNTTPLNAGQAFFALDASNPSNAVTYPGGFQSNTGSAAQKMTLMKYLGSGNGVGAPLSQWTTDGTQPLKSGDIVAFYNPLNAKVYDCAWGACTHQPFPPPAGHWGTPYRVYKVGASSGASISIGDEIYFDRMYNNAWRSDYSITCSSTGCAGGQMTAKSVFKIG